MKVTLGWRSGWSSFRKGVKKLWQILLSVGMFRIEIQSSSCQWFYRLGIRPSKEGGGGLCRFVSHFLDRLSPGRLLIAWRLVWRICMWILGFKGVIERYALTLHSPRLPREWRKSVRTQEKVLRTPLSPGERSIPMWVSECFTQDSHIKEYRIDLNQFEVSLDNG